MVEYASVRSSLYDIDALVSQLNERAGEGWEVVQILPTGGDVTAVLRRSPEPEPAVVEPAYGDGAAVAATTLYDTGEMEAVAADPIEVDEVDVVSDDAGDVAVVEEVAAEDIADVVPADVAASVDEAAPEPPGWAVAPVAVEEAGSEVTEDASSAPEAAAVATDAATEVAPDTAPEAPTAAEVAPVAAAAAVAEPAPAPAPEPTPTPTPPPAPAAAPAAPSIPAGWYPDPSARFELRYWDGSAWTEHVARAGQMYTDPPVA